MTLEQARSERAAQREREQRQIDRLDLINMLRRMLHGDPLHATRPPLDDDS